MTKEQAARAIEVETRPGWKKRRAIVAKVYFAGASVAQVMRSLRRCGVICSRETVRTDMRALGLGVPGKGATRTRSRAEETLAAELETSDLPAARREHLAIPGRRFRFDFAWPDAQLAVEVHGGHWSGGRHVRGKGFERDLLKKRLAVLHGWSVLEFTAIEVEQDPSAVVGIVKEAIDKLTKGG